MPIGFTPIEQSETPTQPPIISDNTIGFTPLSEISKRGKSFEPGIRALTPEMEAKSRPFTPEESQYLRTQKNIELFKAYPRGDQRIEAFVKGILPISTTAPPDVEKAYPFAHAAGQLTGLIATGYATGGIAPIVSDASVIKGAANIMAPAAQTYARMAVGRIAQTGTTFGIKEFVDNMAEMYAGEDKTAKDVAIKTLKATAFGGGLGAVGTIPEPLKRIPAEMGYGFLTAKINGSNNIEAGINAGIFGLFGLMNTKNLSNIYKTEAYKGAKQALSDRFVASGTSREKADNISGRYLNYAIDKSGGWGKTNITDFDKFSNAMKKGWKIVIEPEVKSGVVNPEVVSPQIISTMPEGQPSQEAEVPTPSPTESYNPTVRKEVVSGGQEETGKQGQASKDEGGQALLTPSIATGAEMPPEAIQKIEPDINKVLTGQDVPEIPKPTEKVEPIKIEKANENKWTRSKNYKLTPSQRITLIKARKEIALGEEGDRIPIKDHEGYFTGQYLAQPSTFPEYFRNKGYKSAEVLTAIDKMLNGEKITKKQQILVEDINQGIREQYAKGFKDLRKTSELPAWVLNEGDSLKRGGEVFKVTDIAKNGTITLKDGETVKLDPDATLKYDRGTLKAGKQPKSIFQPTDIKGEE